MAAETPITGQGWVVMSQALRVCSYLRELWCVQACVLATLCTEALADWLQAQRCCGQLPASAMPVYSMIVGSLVGEPIAEYQHQKDYRLSTFSAGDLSLAAQLL